MARIEIEDLYFSYRPEEEILKGVRLTLDQRPTAIIGQNGAGKTTFVKLLKGLLRPTGGRILLDGQDIAGLSAAKLASRIGMVFQNPNDQIFKNTVMAEVSFGPRQIGMPEDKMRICCQKALEAARLTGLEEKNPYDMGLSARKMVAIASILAMDTDTVIFDEPTIAQDHVGKERIRQIIRGLAGEGKSVIAILHDMDFVADVFERVIVFMEGRILMDGSVREVFADRDMLERAYLEQPNVTRLCHELGYRGVYLKVEELLHET